MRFKDKVVLVTGGAAGIGFATAEAFAAEGARIALCDVNSESGEKALRRLGSAAAFHQVDVSNQKAVRAWVDDIQRKWNRIDILVNNAGILRDGLLVKMRDGDVVKQMSEMDFDLVIGVNLKGVYNCTQAVVSTMSKAGGGVILNATSIVGIDGNIGQTNYVATKAGVIGMTKVWARELGQYHIRVNAVAPGFTETDIISAMPEKILAGMRGRTPLGRLGSPQDIANAYLFLASDDASFITGEVLRVDGGLLVGT